MAHLEFEYTQEQLKNTANLILERSLALGATSAQVEMNESIETGVEVLKGNVENFETSYSSSLTMCVYVGHNRGCIGISQVSPHNIDNMIHKALDLAKHTQADPHNGIAEKHLICQAFNENLSLYNPISISNQELINKARNIETLGISQNPKVSTSDGTSLNLGKYNFILANTNGLNQGYQTTRYSSSISLIAQNKDGMQTDYWYDSTRDFNDLISDQELAETAVKRILRRLTKGQIKSGKYSVIFEPSIAKSMVGNFLGAINGGNIYRRLSFLNDSLGKQVFPEWVNVSENPFVVKGSSSCYFDNEGVQVQARDIVSNGKINNYILNCYSARKLGMQSTGNAGGCHNLSVSSNFSGDITVLAKTLNKGLIIIETIGHGLNMVTGDYSVGASGLWVENGEIQFFVDNLSISGNLKQIYQRIQYISDDWNPHSSMACGSILVDGINVSA